MRASMATQVVAGSAAFAFDLTVPGGQVKAAGITDRRRAADAPPARLSARDDALADRRGARTRRIRRGAVGDRGHDLRTVRLRHGLDRGRDRPAARACGAVRTDRRAGAGASCARSTRPSRWSRRSTRAWRGETPGHVRAHAGLVAGPAADRSSVAAAGRRRAAAARSGRSTARRRPMRSTASTRRSSAARRPAMSSWSRRWAIRRRRPMRSGASCSTSTGWRASRRSSCRVDHPLLLSLAAPRRLNFLVREGLWVRLIDVGAALSARGYATGRRRRDRCDRRILSRGTPGAGASARGGVEKTTRRARSRLRRRARSAASISAASPSRNSPARCALRELRAGAIARADAMFRSDRAPWCPELF